MDTPTQLLVGAQVTDALSLAIQVLQMQIQVLERAKASIDGGVSATSGEASERPRRGRSSEAKKRGPTRKIDDQAILDYFKETPSSVKAMAEALGLTLSLAHKRVKELSKSLKRVKEGTSVIYILKPRRNAKPDKADKASKAAAANKNGKAASATN